MTKSILSRGFDRIVRILNKLAPLIIKWPTENEMRDICRKFQQKAGIPNVIGAIDGTYVKIDAPKEHPEEYINRKCIYGITLQALCDSNLKFLDCFAGYPSSVHDVRIFRNSDLYKDVTAHKQRFFPENHIILGDKAYPCLSWCIPPYRNNGRLTIQQTLFNTLHAKTRQTVERSFAPLFGRLRR